jgi:hypothetical protein
MTEAPKFTDKEMRVLAGYADQTDWFGRLERERIAVELRWLARICDYTLDDERASVEEFAGGFVGILGDVLSDLAARLDAGAFLGMDETAETVITLTPPRKGDAGGAETAS